MIVKGSDEEANILSRCLSYVAPQVDGIFITITQPNQEVEGVCKSFKAHISHFDWIGDFSAARNFNFAQVPKEYEYIVWVDADDIVRDFELRKLVKDNPRIDTFSFLYLYDWDEDKQPVVVHWKPRLVRNDGCVTWMGKLHEGLCELRDCRSVQVEGPQILHLSNHERYTEAAERNLEIAKSMAKEEPDDPRSYWNLGQSSTGVNDWKGALNAFQTFYKMSLSEEEKYIANNRMSVTSEQLGDFAKATEYARSAIGLRPEYPDAYFRLAEVMSKTDRHNDAIANYKIGLTKPIPMFKIVVFNPLEYNFNPLVSLANEYILTGRPIEALTCIDAALKIKPNSKQLQDNRKAVQKGVKLQKTVERELKKLAKMKNKTDIKKALSKLDPDVRQHPYIMYFANTKIIKTKSSGKDIVYYCGMTTHEWNPDILKTKGLGGSEEAVINLSKLWAKNGWNVTVYCNTGSNQKKVYDGVTYAPFWEWNIRDKQDITIAWRVPKICDYPINSTRVFVDLHDVIKPGEFTEERLKHIDKVFVKTQAHRKLYPNIPNEKIAVIPNGQDFTLFDNPPQKDQYLLVNTSSPERSLSGALTIFREVKKQVPEAKFEWAYGWGVYDNVHADNAQMMDWKQKIIDEMNELGVINRGRVTQREAAEMYMRGNGLLYPTEFFEIDCITVKKAQAVGCVPITTDFAALNESVQYGIKLHSKATPEDWEKFKFEFGVKDPELIKEFVNKTVELLKTPIDDRTEMREWAKKFDWQNISTKWLEIFNGHTIQ